MNASEPFLELIRNMGISTKNVTAVNIKLRARKPPVITLQTVAIETGEAPKVESAEYEVIRVR